ncbi:YlcI/YnfO family protein [Eleftheria terrae]|uniref:YlcI/YnfO family protein n=1 Tax=Eleftheria terrae TaxID=1597781 RepID=UPI00263B3B17|nr:YlcI/YnfO family protein [Eleftheria terrae]WKB55481.1 prevent-host-death protein [Eleftheria terrae]
MKTATMPAVRVEPELREEVEGLLRDGETLSQFVEKAVRDSVARRRNQAEFLARGLASLDHAKRSGDHLQADTVVAALERRLAQARQRQAAPRR